MAVVYHQPMGGTTSQWVEFQRTEVIFDCLNPDFVTKVNIFLFKINLSCWFSFACNQSLGLCIYISLCTEAWKHVGKYGSILGLNDLIKYHEKNIFFTRGGNSQKRWFERLQVDHPHHSQTNLCAISLQNSNRNFCTSSSRVLLATGAIEAIQLKLKSRCKKKVS